MNAEEARIKSELGRNMSIGNQWNDIMNSIEFQTKLGNYFFTYGDILYPENIKRLEREGFSIIGSRISWNKNSE
jgi:hypothetical protein